MWVIVFYFLFDVGTSFYKDNLLFRTMTNDPNERSKLVIGPRVWTMILGVVTSAFTAVLVAVNEHVGNYHDSFAILITGIVGAAMVLSLIGWFLVKEKHSVQEEEAEPVKFKDFFLLFKENKPMVVYYLKGIFSGFYLVPYFCHACVLHKMGILHGSDHRRHKHGAVWCPQRHFFHDDAHTAAGWCSYWSSALEAL